MVSQIRFIEELSFNAWPAQQTLHFDGWLLRITAHRARRLNSVNPLYASGLAIETKIAHCEQIYTAQGKRVIFKMTDAAQPDDLDTILAARGYSKEAPTSVQILDLRTFEHAPTTEAITCESQLTERWLAAYTRLNNSDPDHIPALRETLSRIIPECCFVSLERADEAAAVGLGVLERGYVGLFDLIINPHYRRLGLGQQVALARLGWARAKGATHAYLQVMLDNAPALALDGKLGFREAYRYWYRVKG